MALANKTTINDLCDDLLCQIFDRLSLKKVIGIKIVNKAFLRSVKTWLKTVDKMFVIKGYISLSKSTGKPSEWPVDYLNTGNELTFYHAKRLLDTFTQINNFSFEYLSGINGSQLVHLVSRCPNINQFSLNFYKLRFNDEDWISLVELIKDCQIKLTVCRYSIGSSPNLVFHLEQLFANARNVKSIEFHRMGVEPLMTIALLNESAEVSLEYCSYNYNLTDEEQHRLADLVSNRVDILKVYWQNFKDLPARRFLKLSHLEINGCLNHGDNFLMPSGFKFMHLKRLIISDSQGHIISSFFVNVSKMEQLEKLEIWSYSLVMNDDQLNAMLEKAANVSQLKIDLKQDVITQLQLTTVPVLVKLFQLLSQKLLPRLRNVSLHIWLQLVSADQFKLFIEPLSAFAGVRSEVKLKLDFSAGNKQSLFKEMIEDMPNNVEINW